MTPDDLPATPPVPAGDPPRTLFDKLGATIPIALTAIATAFAGMSTSEMTQAMYWRSTAAQDQAKAANQWSLAGFKRDRSLIVQASAATLRAAAGYTPVSVTLGPDANTGHNPDAAEWLNGNGPPKVAFPPPEDAAIAELTAMIRQRKPEAEILAFARTIKLPTINKAVDDAEAFVEKVTEHDWDPVVKAAAAIVARATAEAAGKKDSDREARVERAAALQAAGFELESRRYRAEAGLNQQIGFLYEARVKVLTAESDRHKGRSQNFFYSMLAAQIGATVAALAQARKQRSGLWLVAGLAGIAAVGMGVYVYLGM